MAWSRMMAASAATFLMLGAAMAAAKDMLNLGVALEPPHLDPTAGAAAAIDEIVYANVFEGLVRVAEDGTVRPALARAWTVDDGGKVYTFELEEGVTFHDGSGFDAEDVVFTFERAMAEDSTNAQKAIFDGIEKVEAPDPNRVRITLKEPDSSFLFNIGQGDAVIVAPETAATNKNRPVGTGPFEFQSWTKGSAVSLNRREDYWGDQPSLAHVAFTFIPDPSAAVAAMLAGDVDGFPNFPAPENLSLFENDDRFTVAVGTTEGETILAINHRRPPLDRLEVRRAIAHAIDREAIVTGAYFGYGTPIGSHFSPHHPAYVDLTGMYPHDSAKARHLLEEAGVEDLRLTLKLPPTTYARRGGEIVASELKEVGIEVEIIPVEWAQWLEQVFTNHDFDLTIVAHTEPLDINIYARDDYYFGYDSDAFDAIMEDLRTSPPEGRQELLKQAQEQIARDSVNAFLFQLPKLGVWDAGLEGLWRNSPIQANDVTAVRWRE